jgi:hypothetical protein
MSAVRDAKLRAARRAVKQAAAGRWYAELSEVRRLYPKVLEEEYRNLWGRV